MGESLAKTGEAKQPLLKNLPKDSAPRALGRARGAGRGRGPSAGASPERRRRKLGLRASPCCSEPKAPSESARMGEGQMVLLGRLMKRPGDGKGFLGERQEGEKGLEGEGGTQVPVYTARWGLGAVCWPDCKEERAQSEWSPGPGTALR